MPCVSEDRLRNAMSGEWQEEEFRKDCALAQSMAGESGEKYLTCSEETQRKFAQFPYSPGTEVPPFALEEGGKLTPYSGFAFDKTGEDGKSVILGKWQIGQLKKQVTISNTLYAEMIANARRAANREEPQREMITRFEAQDQRYGEAVPPLPDAFRGSRKKSWTGDSRGMSGMRR